MKKLEKIKLNKDKTTSSEYFIEILALFSLYNAVIFPIIIFSSILISIIITLITFNKTGLLGLVYIITISIVLLYITLNILISYISYRSQYRFIDMGINKYFWILYLIINLSIFNLVPIIYLDLSLNLDKYSLYINYYLRFTIFICIPLFIILNLLLFFKSSKSKEDDNLN